jgi:hypothetical protein
MESVYIIIVVACKSPLFVSVWLAYAYVMKGGISVSYCCPPMTEKAGSGLVLFGLHVGTGFQPLHLRHHHHSKATI